TAVISLVNDRVLTRVFDSQLGVYRRVVSFCRPGRMDLYEIDVRRKPDKLDRKIPPSPSPLMFMSGRTNWFDAAPLESTDNPGSGSNPGTGSGGGNAGGVSAGTGGGDGATDSDGGWVSVQTTDGKQTVYFRTD